MIPERVAISIASLLVPVALVVMVVGSPNLLGLVVVLGVAVLVVALGRPRNRVVEPAWTVAGSGAGPGGEPARGSVSWSLGTVEIRELALNPWFHVGLGFCIIFLVAISSFEKSWWSTAELLPVLIHPLCGLTIVAVHRNATRSRRDGTAELFESCPATDTARRRALLVAGAVPVLFAMSFVSALLIGAAAVLDGIYGPMGTRVAFNVVVAGLLLPLGAVALGLALARATRSTLAPIAMVGVVAVANLLVVEEPDGLAWFATARVDHGSDVVFFDPPLIGRLLWIGGLVLAVVMLAAPVRRSLRVPVGGAIVVVLGIGGFLNLRDLSEGAVARLAGYAASSPEYSTCFSLVADDSLEVCAPRPYREHGEAMAANLRPVAGAVSTDALTESLTLGFPPADPDFLPAQVEERLVSDGFRLVVPLPFGHHRSHFGTARFQLAAIVTGVFTGDDPENVLVDGQARGVVLIWLATRGMTDHEIEQLLTPYSRESASHGGHIWPGICGAPIQWAPEDVAAARLVVQLDDARVREALDSSWDQWIDPATPTDDLMLSLGLPSQGPPSPIEPLGGIC